MLFAASAVSGVDYEVAFPRDKSKVDNLLRRRNLGDVDQDDVVRALTAAEGSIEKGAEILRAECEASETGCTMQWGSGRGGGSSRDSDGSKKLREKVVKANRQKIMCEVCNLVIEDLDTTMRQVLPGAKEIETGFRLRPDGTRDIKYILEPRTEEFFVGMLRDVCRDQKSKNAPKRPQLWLNRLKGVTSDERKQYETTCHTFVSEFESELTAIKDWARETPEDEHAMMFTPDFEGLKSEMCTERTAVCKEKKKKKKKKSKKSKKTGGKQDL